MKTLSIVLTLEVLEALFEGNIVTVLVADGAQFELSVDPAELALSRDAIEKSMLALMPTPPMIN